MRIHQLQDAVACLQQAHLSHVLGRSKDGALCVLLHSLVYHMHSTLRRDPQMLRYCYQSPLTAAHTAQQVCKLEADHVLTGPQSTETAAQAQHTPRTVQPL